MGKNRVTGNIMSDDLRHRLEWAESTLAIQALMRRYSNLCDRGFDPPALATLFTADGVWDGGEEVGRYEGPAAIRDFMARLATVVAWSGHFVVNEEFEVQGRKATGFWRCMAVVNNTGDEPPTDKWYFQDYHFTCAHTEDGWRFRSIRTDLRKATAYMPHLTGQMPVTR
jgi:hypothetical protein